MTDTPENVLRWCRNRQDEVSRREACSSVGAMAEQLGVPAWHIYKVVLSSVEEQISQSHSGSPRKEKIGDLVSECIAYARQCTREDGFKPVWTGRALEHIQAMARELFRK